MMRSKLSEIIHTHHSTVLQTRAMTNFTLGRLSNHNNESSALAAADVAMFEVRSAMLESKLAARSSQLQDTVKAKLGDTTADSSQSSKCSLALL